MGETFPHHYEDGYVITGMLTTGWEQVFYGKIYRNTKSLPYQWNTLYKRHKPVAIFTQSQWRSDKVGEKECWFCCELIYKYSAN